MKENDLLGNGNKPKGGLLGGILACLYCVVAGFLGLRGGAYNFFINDQASMVAILFGIASIVLMILLSRQFSTIVYLLGRNLSIAFAIVLLMLFFLNGSQPGLQQIFRLVLQLAVVWIIFSTFIHMRKAALLKSAPDSAAESAVESTVETTVDKNTGENN